MAKKKATKKEAPKETASAEDFTEEEPKDEKKETKKDTIKMEKPKKSDKNALAQEKAKILQEHAGKQYPPEVVARIKEIEAELRK